MRNLLSFLNWYATPSKKEFHSGSLETLDINTPTKHLIIFPGGYYLCGHRSWSSDHLNWIYHFPGQVAGYLVNSPFTRTQMEMEIEGGQPENEIVTLDVYYNFCPGRIWQYLPKIVADLDPHIQIQGPLIISKCGNNKDEEPHGWTEKEVLSIISKIE